MTNTPDRLDEIKARLADKFYTSGAARNDIGHLIAEVERLRDLVMESAPVTWAAQSWQGGGVHAAEAWEKRAVEMLGKPTKGGGTQI